MKIYLKIFLNHYYFKFLLFPLMLLCVNLNLSAQDISVEKFSKIPKYVDGCGCYFYLNKTDERNNNYIYIGVGDYSAMKIDGLMQKLKRITENHDNGYYGKFSNESYEVKIFGKKTGEYEEGYIYKGKVTVRNKDSNAKTTIKFIGACGC